MNTYIGIDIGTSSAKLTLIDNSGQILKESSREYNILEVCPGWKEIDPECWMNAIDQAMQELLIGFDAKSVKGIGVTGQMHTVVLIGNDGKSIRPALMWNDTRTSNRVAQVKEQIRSISSVSYIANVISTGSPAMNLLWLKENEPDTFNKIYKFVIGPDYIVYRLTGSLQTDFCEASTSSLFDLNNGIWSKEIQQLLGFPWTIYPEVKGTNEIAGTVKDSWANQYGFQKDIPVIVGTGDNPAAAISTGCFSKKYPVLSLGTSGVLMFPKDKIDFGAKGKNIMFSFDRNNIQILVQGVVQSCGSSMNWWIRNILDTKDYNKETDMNIDLLGQNKLFFYPHLVGDKTIYADPNLRGSFIGLGTETTRKDMTVAVMEGIAFGVKQLTEVMKIPNADLQNLKITGGGSKNEVWMQIFADILGVNIEQLEAGAGAGYGMALSVASVVEDISMNEILDQVIQVKKVFYPRENFVKRYNKKYETYLKIHDALYDIYHE